MIERATPPRIVVVLRPTVSGIDEKSAAALIDSVRAQVSAAASIQADDGAAVIEVAYLDIATPTIHQQLDAAHAADVPTVVLIPVAVPRDKYLLTWTARAVANWRETRPDAQLEVRLAEPTGIVEALAGRVAAAAASEGTEITASPASYRSPAWSKIEHHDRHVLVCKGPRCMAYGAGPLHRELTSAAKGTSTKVTGTGCLSPCNLGPLAVVNPPGDWYGYLSPDDAEELVSGAGPEHRKLLR